MGQVTLIRMVPVETKVPIGQLQPAEMKIWNYLRRVDRGKTHDQIKEALRQTGIQVFDNKLRSLRQKGYVTSHKGPDGILLWYYTQPEESK